MFFTKSCLNYFYNESVHYHSYENIKCMCIFFLLPLSFNAAFAEYLDKFHFIRRKYGKVKKTMEQLNMLECHLSIFIVIF